MSKAPDWMTLREVSQALGIPEGTLRSWRFRNYGPASFKVGVSVVYLRSDVDAWARDQAEQVS